MAVSGPGPRRRADRSYSHNWPTHLHLWCAQPATGSGGATPLASERVVTPGSRRGCAGGSPATSRSRTWWPGWSPW
ncbi:hypothetical protein E1258_32160 [Micromonospora sp. KC207]|nr:hypothetical protein E1258_32160 [Micromonospora sp. KC207]